MTQGDGDYGHHSIESMAQLVARRLPPVPVVFLRSTRQPNLALPTGPPMRGLLRARVP